MRHSIVWILLTTALFSSMASSEEPSAENSLANACFSTDPELGDSAAWAINSVQLYANDQFADAVSMVDACFSQWGPEAGQKQKKLHDRGKSCPSTGKVSRKERLKIQKDYLMNDVSMALWAKARSLHELGQVEAAKNTYAQCIYMTCGRAWDPKGWFWSPAQDCANQVKSLLD